MQRFLAKLDSLSLWRRATLAFFAGGVLAFSQPPFFLLPLCFLSLPLLVLLFDGLQNEGKPAFKRALRFFATAFAFGFGYFVFGLYWIMNALLVEGATALMMIPFALFGFPALLALFWGVGGVICSLFWRNNLSRIFLIALAFGISEWMRATFFTGFPWNSIGYSAMPVPLLMQSAALFNLFAMNILASFVYAMPAMLFSGIYKKTGLVLAFLLIVFHVGFGAYRLTHAPMIDDAANQTAYRVRIIQPSIDQSEKLDAQSRRMVFDRHLDLTAEPVKAGEKAPDIVIWPETSVPYLLDYVPQAREAIADVLPDHAIALLGAVRLEKKASKDHYFNTIEALDQTGEIIAASDKLHLVPFGEYMPLENIFNAIGLRAVAELTGGYSTADTRYSVTLPNQLTYLPLICYEIIFPHEMTYQGAKPDFIVNVTNDAWYGNSPGPWQHLHQAQIRAVETGLPVLRAANNGISAVIDSYGRMVSMLGYNEIGFIDAQIPVICVSIWNNFINFLAILIIFCALFAGFALFLPQQPSR